MTEAIGSCYPNGLQTSRRAFLRALSAAAIASGVRLPEAFAGQQQTEPDVYSTEQVVRYPEGAVRLNFNENPLGPSPRAITALLQEGLQGCNRYGYVQPVIEALAARHTVSQKQILLGCGSTEILQIAPWSFLRDGGSLVYPEPTYDWSAGVAKAMGARVVPVPLGREGTIDVAALKKAIDRQTRIVYFANPNNPTGAALHFEELQSLVNALPSGALLVVDEAYYNFLPGGTQGKTAIDLARGGAPVIAVRTFSKAFGLAALRLGYAVGPEALIDKLRTFSMADLGINAAVIAAAPAALADEEHVGRYVQCIDQGLEYLRAGLQEMGIKPWPHRAPFLIADLGRESKPILEALVRRKVYVRDGNAWSMPTCLRISVGLAADNEAFLKTLRQVNQVKTGRL